MTRGLCTQPRLSSPLPYGQQAGGMHPTGTLSCYYLLLIHLYSSDIFRTNCRHGNQHDVVIFIVCFAWHKYALLSSAQTKAN